MPTGQSDGGSSSIEVSSPSLCQGDKNYLAEHAIQAA